MALVGHLLHGWRRKGVRLNAGASDARLASLSTLLSCTLPPELVQLYSAADGMVDCAHDAHLVSFWPIRRILHEAATSDGSHVPFADVLIESWRFFFGSSGDQLLVLSGNVRPGDQLKCIGTFVEFLEMYIDSPADLNL